MADTTTTTISDEEQNKPTNPIISFISSVLQLFKPPPPSPSKKTEPTAAATPSEQSKPTTASVEVVEEKPASVVKFPPQELPSLKLESDGTAEPNTNPVVLYQVYAIGAFFVLKWAWSRWNERRGNRKPSDGEPPPPAQE